MNKWKAVAVLAALVPVSACTTRLQASRVAAGDPVPAAGAPYNLAYTRFKVKVVRRVVSCFARQGEGEADADTVPALKLQVQAKAVAEQVRDPQRSYVIDLESLQSFFKTSNVQVAYYDSGALKSINASAEDKTGEFIASIAGMAAKLVMPVTSAALSVKPAPPCSPEVATAVAAVDRLEEVLADRTDVIVARTAELKQLVDLAATAGRNYPPADRSELVRRMRELITLQRANARTTAEIEKHLELIAVRDEVTWPADGETFVSANPVVPALDDAQVRKWTGLDKAIASTIGATAVYLELAASEPIGRSAPCGTTCADDTVDGLKYRMPAMGALSMCAELTAATAQAPARCAKPEAIIPAAMISQLGRIYTLPLKSAMFGSKSVTATFAENGMPTLVGTTTAAASDKAAGTLSGLVDAAVSVRNSRAGREAAELQGQIDVLTLRRELQEATAALAPAPASPKQEAIDAFTLDTALLNAELANRKAQAALDDARRSAPGN